MTAPFADFDLHDTWKLTSDEINALRNKSGATRLGFAVLLKFFQAVGRFPCDAQEVPRQAVEDLARQVGVPPAAWFRYYDRRRRAMVYHRTEIRAALGFREATIADGEELGAWLLQHVEYAPGDGQLARVTAAAYERCKALRFEPPTPEQLERLVRSVMRTQDERFAAATSAQLTAETRALLDALILEVPFLRSGPGSAGLESIQAEVKKLESLRGLHIPEALFRGVAGSVLRAHRQCVSVQESFELRRHPEAIRMTQMAAFCHLRGREVTDTLVDLLLGSIHKIGTKAERKVMRELIADLKRVNGKEGLLFRMAEASLAEPDGAVKDVVFPVVSEETLRDLVREAKASGRAFRIKVQVIKRNSYRSHYRRMVPLVLGALDFRSNNEIHQPVIKAVGLLHKYLDSKDQCYPAEEDVPIEGVVRKALREAVCQPDVEGCRIRRIDYEMCVLEALREKLRCKEIWVVGANRYRNPDEDLPQDFDQKRGDYYVKLKMPRAAKTFTDQLRREMAEELDALDRDIPTNRYVEILAKKGGWIKLSPLPVQVEPQNLDALKGEIMRRWSITTLLDILKETDLRVGFTDVFRSATARENMNRDVLQPRLLLSLFGLGTNAGLKRVCAGQDAATYKDLLYVRRRFITTAHLREVIRRVANAIFDVRQATIWGDGTTACVSDSKKLGAYDQNLMTEYHARYRGAGIMIYWHVERKAVCVYGQLKTCSSSETAAMIQGVLRHCTSMQFDKNYVDSHGQSEVAFAFCRLLGFQLLPRIKAIHRQRLYRAESGRADAYPNLQHVLTRPINWELIEQQYDEMIKYTTALREGTADAESILRRFTRANVQHPTCSALAELGRTQRTIFLCQYLRLEALRREIEEGLNVVENWNSANGFIFYGKGGDFASNDQDDQECSMLCLHLLQICLVYINTLMIQQVLAAPAWMQRMEPEDMRGLTPLIYSHVTPYGSFRLDMSTRLMIDGSEATPAWPSATAAYAG